MRSFIQYDHSSSQHQSAALAYFSNLQYYIIEFSHIQAPIWLINFANNLNKIDLIHICYCMQMWEQNPISKNRQPNTNKFTRTKTLSPCALFVNKSPSPMKPHNQNPSSEKTKKGHLLRRSKSKPTEMQATHKKGVEVLKKRTLSQGIRWKKAPQKTSSQWEEMSRGQTIENFKRYLLSKVADHRRFRSSYKISMNLIQLDTFFKKTAIKDEEQFDSKHRKSKTEAFDEQQLSALLTQKSQLTLKHQPKVLDLMSSEELNNSKQIIKKIEEMRKQSKIKPNPKQWQFHNCLSLQNIELYSTNLKISCEGWVVLDHLELKYLRGWNPKAVDDFTPMIKLFLAYTAYELHNTHVLNLQQITYRAYEKHINCAPAKSGWHKDWSYGIPPNAILSLDKLIIGMLVNQHQDFITHTLFAIGHLLTIIEHSHQVSTPQADLKKTLQNLHIFVKEATPKTLYQYYQQVQNKCLQICSRLFLSNTEIRVGSKQVKMKNDRPYSVQSSSLDISILFMKCLKESRFTDALNMRVCEAEVKYQIGWSFWEPRVLEWKNYENVKYGLKAVGGKSERNNECYAIWDESRKITIVMADCKVNMHWRDTERIQDWVQKHISRFTKKYCLGLSFYPTDTEKLHRIN